MSENAAFPLQLSLISLPNKVKKKRKTAHTFDDSKASAAIRRFYISTRGEEMLTRRVSTAQAVARLGPKKGGNGVGKDESYTSFSMLDDYNTLLQRKALFPS